MHSSRLNHGSPWRVLCGNHGLPPRPSTPSPITPSPQLLRQGVQLDPTGTYYRDMVRQFKAYLQQAGTLDLGGSHLDSRGYEEKGKAGGEGSVRGPMAQEAAAQPQALQQQQAQSQQQQEQQQLASGPGFKGAGQQVPLREVAGAEGVPSSDDSSIREADEAADEGELEEEE